MSFFDEVETTVANTRFLQAVEDHGPIVLPLKPAAELPALAAELRASLTIDLLLCPSSTPSIASYLFKQFLASPLGPNGAGQEDALHLFVALDKYKQASSKTRLRLAKQILHDHPPLAQPPPSPSNPAVAAAASSSSSSSPALSGAAAAYAVPASAGVAAEPAAADSSPQRGGGGARVAPLSGVEELDRPASSIPSGVGSALPSGNVSPGRIQVQQRQLQQGASSTIASSSSSPAADVSIAASSSSSAASSSTAAAAATADPPPPCLELVLAAPLSSHPCCTYLAQQVPHKLAQVQEMLGLARSHSHVDNNNAKLSESLFDCVLARLRLRLSEFVSPFLSSRSYFPRLVSLTEFARRPVTLDSFRSFRVLGRGAFGAVSAVQRKDTHAIYALKEMDKKQVKAEQSEWMVQNEMHVLSKTRSPFVLGLNYAFHGADLLHLVFPMCTGGDLKFHLRAAEGHRFSESRTRYYASELLLGLEHLHGLDIVYRDLKPQNILLTSGGHLVISDLGLSIKLRKGKVLKHLAGCLRADQEVLRDDGVSVIRADQVRVGMRLAGEHGPVVVEEASPDLASLPTSSDFYRITHEDGSSYVVTGCADAMHLVTVRCTRATVSLRRRVQSCCGRQVMYFANAFDSQTNELRGEYAPRTYRAIDESSDDTLDIPERGMQHQHHCSCVERNALPTLVRQTLAECEAAMWSSWEREELTDPKSLPARASTEGSLVDIPVVTLAANPSWWRHAPDQPTQQTVQPFLSGVRIMTMSKDAAPPHAQHDVALLPPPEHDGGHGHRVLPSSFLSSMAHKKVTCQSLAIASIVPEPTLSPFAPFKVGGNGRYRLVDGTLTHNTAGYWSPEVLSKKGTFKSSDLFSLGVMIYEMLSGARPECKCAKKGAHATGGAGSNNSAAASKEWCPFGQRRSMEENAVDPEGVLRLELEPWPSSISSNPLARDLLTKLLDPNPETRLGAQDLEHIKSHAWFADTDWEAMAKLEVDPPYVPEPRTVNAHSISEVGEADRRGFAHINLTAEDQRAYDDCFRYTSAEGAQQEVVDALTKMDNPHSANNAAANSADQGGDGCCTIL